MKKTFLFILLLSLYLSNLLAQERTTMDLLTSYKWIVKSEFLEAFKDPEDPDTPYPLEAYMIYSTTTCTIYERWSDEPNVLKEDTYRYYLEDQLDSDFFKNPISNERPKFVASKVGSNRMGSYILEERKNTNSAGIYQIKELTETNLVLFSLGTLGGGESVYEARPKD
ncbi:MAG: hypothetical protein LIO65_05785 [Odoribacter sp.]|nr:hypothetical protein [Odoribacter sp.]